MSEAEGSSGVGRGMLTHRHVLSRIGGNSWTRRTSPGTGLRDQICVVHALRHEADCPHVTTQLIHLPIFAERLHFAAVYAKINVTDTTDLAVVSGVGVYYFNEISITRIQTIHQAWSEKRTRGI